MKDQNELEQFLKQRLDEIKLVPPRDPKTASRARAQFLGMAVSASEFPRQKGWKSIFRKERFAMNAILSILVIAGLLFGGGMTVSAAQDALPNEPLYPVKTWTEDLSLQLQKGSEDRVNRLMELAQVRVQEMDQLVANDKTIPDMVQLRLEQHIQQALQTCLTMDDPTLERTLLQIRDRLQDQDRDLEQLQLHTQDRLLTQTRDMIQQRLQLVDDGLLNHEMFRYQMQNGFKHGQDEEFTPPAQNGNGQQNGQPTEEPGGPNLEPGGPNTDPGGPNLEPGGPNTDPGGPNLEPGGPNTDPGGPNTDSGGPNTDPGGPNTDSGNQNPDSGGNTNDSGNGFGGSGTNSNGSGGNGKP